MKSLSWLILLLSLLVGLPSAWAETLQPGVYIGGGGRLQWLPGTGTWDQSPFKITSPVSSEDSQEVGFAWNDQLLLGVMPQLGYRLNPGWALEVGYTMNIAKGSSQSFAETDLNSYYVQGVDLEWQHRSLEALVIFNPSADLNYYFFGGLDLTRVTVNALVYEEITTQDAFGNPTTVGEYQDDSDDVSALGLILGGGMEFPATGGKRVIFISGQYSTAKTSGSLFGTDDFKVSVGGLSLVGGIKLHLFGGK